MRPLFGCALVLAFGCGGSGGNTDAVPPTAEILFPPRGTVTEAASLSVTGNASDDRGVARVSVGGVNATTTDRFATWLATVPLASGTNVVVASATDGAGNVSALATAPVTRLGIVPAAPTELALAPDGRALVLDTTLRMLFFVDLGDGATEPLAGTGPALFGPSGLAVDAAANRALLCDLAMRAVLAVDLVTGERTIVSDDLTGAGDPLAFPVAVAPLAPGVAAVADSLAGRIVRIDLATGDRSLLAPLGVSARALLHDAANGRLLVLAATALVAIDTTTGAESVIADAATGAGPALTNPTGFDRDAASGVVYVTDSVLDAVLAVDPATGDRTIVSDANVGSGLALSFPRAVVKEGARLLVIDAAQDALLSVDPATGVRAVVAGAAVGTGEPFVSPRDVAFDPARGRALVLDLAHGVLAVDANGDRLTVSGPGTGSGPDFVSPLGLSAPRADAVLVADSGAGALFAVELATGARTVLSDGGGFAPTDAAYLSDRVLALDGSAEELVEIDPATGARTTIASGLNLPRSLAIDAGRNRALILQAGATPLVAVDLATGATAAVDAGTLVDPRGLGMDDTAGRLFITDDGSDALVVLDLTNGSVTSLAGGVPRFAAPNGVAYDAARRLALVADSGRGVLFAVEPGTDARVIVSK